MKAKSVWTGLLFIFVGALLLPYSYISLLAQDNNIQDNAAFEQCNTIVSAVHNAILECSDINRNWACYGKIRAEVDPVKYRFHALRDRRAIEALNKVDTDSDGVVLLNLHTEGEANPIRAIMFGDARLETRDAQQHNFLFVVEDTLDMCKDTKPGIIIRTISGRSSQIILNNVTIQLGSTAYITIDSRGWMTVANVEGQITVIINGVFYEVPEGGEIRIDVSTTPPRFLESLQISPLAGSEVAQWISKAPQGLRSVINSNEDPTSEVACIGKLEFGKPIVETLNNPGHECLFSVCADPGQKISVNLNAISDGLNPWVDLRLPNGRLYTFNNDIGEGQTDSLLCNIELPPVQELDGCYLLVARSHHNASAGQFELTLNKETGCSTPEPRCEVMTYRGLNLRTGPGVEFSLAAATPLPQDTHLEPVGVEENGWRKVRVNNTALEGYVNTDPRYLLCEGIFTPESPTATATPTPTMTPTSSPVVDSLSTDTPTPTLVVPPGVETSTPTLTSTATPSRSTVTTASPTSTPVGTLTSTPTGCLYPLYNLPAKDRRCTPTPTTDGSGGTGTTPLSTATPVPPTKAPPNPPI